mmetsp:Transcript_49017/g.88617  ORF Transcript_49017/g.88617 Transcript_49017/m.88617 type:complete len:343 (-) Transcript_49017:90-1118(-)
MSLGRFFWAFGACREGSCANGSAEAETVTEDVHHGEETGTSEHYQHPTLFEVMCQPSRREGGRSKDEGAGAEIGVRALPDRGLHRMPTEESVKYEAEAEAPGLLEQVRWMFNSANCQPHRRDFSNDVIVGPPQEPQLLQEAMMTFIRTLLRGVCIEVLLDDGSVLFPEASLNYELTHLILHVNENEAQRAIALKDVESVATPLDLEQRNIVTSIQPYLDERCCTLIIRDYEFVTFRFDTERLREYFASCLRLLITAPSGEPPSAALEIASEVVQSRDGDSMLGTRSSAEAACNPGSAGASGELMNTTDAGASQSGASNHTSPVSTTAVLDPTRPNQDESIAT